MKINIDVGDPCGTDIASVRHLKSCYSPLYIILFRIMLAFATQLMEHLLALMVYVLQCLLDKTGWFRGCND